MKHVFIFLLFACCLNGIYAQHEAAQTYHIIFQNKAGDSLLQSNVSYHNSFGEAFTVRSCKYYISHIQFHYQDGKQYLLPALPHLVNEADSSSKEVTVSAPAGIVTGIRFLLGIDSITNVSGVQTGDLDPAKGMFWVWNTGYIMAKLEGASPSSKAPGKQYSYDVGGYKTGENGAREIHLALSSATSHQLSTFVIMADISKWFSGKNNIRIAEQPMCHSPGKLAMQIADNYADMFRLSAAK